MKRNETAAAILAINPAMLRGLHIKMGYDFEQEITIRRIPAPFTIRAAWKAIEADGHTPRTSAAALIMRDTQKDTWLSRPHMVPLTADNLRDDFDKVAYSQYDRRQRYITIFDDFISKRDFHDLRKKPTCEAFIIAQQYKLLRPWAEPARDWTERQRDMEPGEHAQQCRVYYGNRRPTITIDKSNYRTDLKRDDLKRRAAKLRADRAKAAADTATRSTATDRYNKLLAAFTEARQRVIKALVSIDPASITGDTALTLKAAGEALTRYSAGLEWIASDISRFMDSASNHKFTSPANYDAAYNGIMTRINAVMPEEV